MAIQTVTRTHRATIRNQSQVRDGLDTLGFAASKLWNVGRWTVARVWEEYSLWTINACKKQAEPIIEEGQSQRYRHAVQWLETAGNAADTAGELDEWRAYVQELKDEHYQKYKLRPMLEELLSEFEKR